MRPPMGLPDVISNPLRWVGLARVVAGGWFLLTVGRTLGESGYLLGQAARIFGGDIGATSAPYRSLLMLILTAALVVIGVRLVVNGIRSMRRLHLPVDGPAPLDRDEVFAVLVRRELPAYANGGSEPYRLLRVILGDQSVALPRWRRKERNRSVRTFAWACALVVVVAGSHVAVSQLAPTQLLGPFPTDFVLFFPLAAMIFAVLGLMAIGSDRPEIRTLEFRIPAKPVSGEANGSERIVESNPTLLDREPPGLGVTLGISGVAVQCLMLVWWNLSPIGYPLLATSLIRMLASIGAGILFFVLGGKMVAMASRLLLTTRYDSTVVMVEGDAQESLARAARMRTQSSTPHGPRHILAAVAGPQARSSAEELL